MCFCCVEPVGSGPSCWLARRKPVHSLVIHSGFMSGLRVMTDNRLLCCFDIFPNMSALQRVTVPVFIIHGQHDEEVRGCCALRTHCPVGGCGRWANMPSGYVDTRQVPIHHAIGNLNAISSEPQIQPWLPEFGTHNDLYHRYACCACTHLCQAGDRNKCRPSRGGVVARAPGSVRSTWTICLISWRRPKCRTLCAAAVAHVQSFVTRWGAWSSAGCARPR